MVTIEDFRKLALAYPEAVEEPHFERTSFRVKKKIFATLDQKQNLACLKFSEIDQSVFHSFDSSIFYPVPNSWGKKGYTYVNLNKAEVEMIAEALTLSYTAVAPAKLAAQIQSSS